MEAEVMKMKEFYSFTKEDLPELVSFFKKEDEMVKQKLPDGKERRLLFLLRLVIDLIADAERNRKLKTTLERIRQMNKKKIIEVIIKILGEWLEENGGVGNFHEVIKVFRSNGYSNFASLMERFLLQYSLPISEDGHSREVDVYSLSSDFLLEEYKDVSLGSVPLWNANPVEQALQNSVILKEVFRKLNSRDQKMFRLVTPTWKKETFPYWRRSSVLQLHVPNPKYPDGRKENGILMTSFVKLLDLEESFRKRKGKNVETKHRLLEHPFHRYKLSYPGNKYNLLGVPFSCGKEEVKFWQLCGPSIEDLQIDEALFGTAPENTAEKICEKIFATCPKLKMLKILGSCRTDLDAEFLFVNNESLPKKTEKNNGKIASELHTLAVEGYITEANLRRILFHCPNLKVLNIESLFEETSNALLHPTSNGGFLKLEKLSVKYSPDPIFADKFLPLRNYSEMLMNKGFNCLQHLTLEGFSLSDARKPPFNLYAALARSSQNLKTLQLMISYNYKI